MEIDEDKDVPLMLERPLTKTAKVVIDVDKGKLKMGTQNDETIFDGFGTPEEYMRIEVNFVVKTEGT